MPSDKWQDYYIGWNIKPSLENISNFIQECSYNGNVKYECVEKRCIFSSYIFLLKNGNISVLNSFEKKITNHSNLFQQ